MRKVFVGTVSKTETLIASEKQVFYAIYLQSINVNNNGDNQLSMQCTVKSVEKDKLDGLKPIDIINGGNNGYNAMQGQNNESPIDIKISSITLNIPLKEIPVCDFSGQKFKSADEQETFKNDHYLLSYLNKEVLLGQKKWEELK